MTQPQRNEERLLDYLYGELDADARAQVEADLASSPALREELEGHRRVRKAFAELPRPEQSPESAQRMTALLMQQAAQQASAQRAPSAGEGGGSGGKLLLFQPRTLRRVFANPATGIFAAAAAALFWVVFKTQAPTAPPTAEPIAAKPTTATKASPAEMAKASPPAELQQEPAAVPQDLPAKKSSGAPVKDANPQVWAQLSRNATSDTLARGPDVQAVAGDRGIEKSATTAAPIASATPAASVGPFAGRGKAKGSLDGKLMAVNDPPPAPKTYAAKAELAELPRYGATVEAKKDAAPPRPTGGSEGYAPPPPPAANTPSVADAEGGVQAGIAQTQARRNQRVIEELANQELAAMPGTAGPGAAGSGARPGSQAPAAPTAPEGERYAQAESVDKSVMEDENKPGNRANNQRSRDGAGGAAAYAQNAVPTQAVPTNNIDRQNNLPLLSAVQDLLRQGRCGEANAALIRIEQSFPATRGLTEARAQWQRSCSPGNSATNQLPQERPMLAQPIEPQQAVPMAAPAPSSREVMRKRAAPARAKPSPSKTADSAAAF